MPTLQTGEPLDVAGLAGDAKKDLQGQLLSDLVVRLAGSGNAFWEERLADIDPGSVTSLDNLSQLPFTVKQDLRDQYPLGMVISPMEATTSSNGRKSPRSESISTRPVYPWEASGGAPAAREA